MMASQGHKAWAQSLGTMPMRAFLEKPKGIKPGRKARAQNKYPHGNLTAKGATLGAKPKHKTKARMSA